MKRKTVSSMILTLLIIGMSASILPASGQIAECFAYDYELYVDEYTQWWEWDWNIGIPPGEALFGPPDGSYISSSTHGAITSLYSFEDINLLPGEVITEVVLEGYTNGPYNADIFTDAVDYDVYTFPNWVWLGSLYATGSPAWVTRRYYPWTVDEVYPAALTEAGLNSLEVLLYFFDPYNVAVGDDIIDSLRLKVKTEVAGGAIDVLDEAIVEFTDSNLETAIYNAGEGSAYDQVLNDWLNPALNSMVSIAGKSYLYIDDQSSSVKNGVQVFDWLKDAISKIQGTLIPSVPSWTSELTKISDKLVGVARLLAATLLRDLEGKLTDSQAITEYGLGADDFCDAPLQPTLSDDIMKYKNAWEQGVKALDKEWGITTGIAKS